MKTSHLITLLTLTTATALADISYNRWNGIPGSTLASALADPDVPRDGSNRPGGTTGGTPPDVTLTLTSFDTPGDNTAENYFGQIIGLFTPATTGIYDFWLAGDDEAALFLNPAGTAESGRIQIAREPIWSFPKYDFTGSSRRTAGAEENRSSTLYAAGFSLVAGSAYYIEGVWKEGVGGDHLEVAATIRNIANPAVAVLPANNASAVIPGSQLSVIPEPSSAILFVAGALGFLASRQQTRRPLR